MSEEDVWALAAKVLAFGHQVLASGCACSCKMALS